MNSYQACFVIPNYNHHLGFDEVIEGVVKFSLPIIVVNDGSEDQTSQVLKNIESEQSLITVVNLPVNQGKGGAVMAGLQYAYQQGFTHALQVDADGQHDLKDVSRFFEESQNNPEHLISGYPVYDESVPLGRLIPRYITHFWVWVETLSFHIKDSMCGFRVYPLREVIPVIEQNRIGRRMDFDIEILVRSYWQNINIQFFPTKVIYPEEGVSHFQLFKDNWLITKMHTKLFFGMLRRIPKLISRKVSKSKSNKVAQSPKTKHWAAKKEKGSLFGLNFLVWIYKVFGKWLFTFLLYPVIAYFVVSSKEARRSSAIFWSKFYAYQGINKRPTFFHIYRHFYEFGLGAIDKIACWMGDIKRNDVILHNQELFQQVVEQGKGAVFIGSHLGNLELCRAIGEQSEEFKINAVVFNKHAPKFQQALSKSNKKVDINLIHVESMGPETAILFKQKIEQGEVIIIVGDRTSFTTFGRVQYADFLGSPAPFAEGPYILAGILECPTYLLFCLREKGTYNIYLEHFADSLKFPRAERQQKLKETIQRFADRLTFYCQKAPMQWFNFYDFWSSDDPEKITKLSDQKLEK